MSNINSSSTLPLVLYYYIIRNVQKKTTKTLNNNNDTKNDRVNMLFTWTMGTILMNRIKFETVVHANKLEWINFAPLIQIGCISVQVLRLFNCDNGTLDNHWKAPTSLPTKNIQLVLIISWMRVHWFDNNRI